ncbi:MAG: S16 family serine protease [Candidatus Brocadiia bacterium]|nr:S16 family serine protease [Candidatus Brocadiia bacterium]
MLLCFVGPPGVGKTSFGRSIARATGRRFHRIALGGMRGEAEIRGHRRTYVGALPGRFIRALRTVGVSNPIFMLDEVDKLGAGVQGDPAAALLEVLDPEQNNSFTDNYLGVPFDLSRIMFICTANTQTTIPASLLDRLEVIQLSGYSIEEKVQIARRHLLPKQLSETGLRAESLTIGDDVIAMMAERYTRESGVRSLERQLAALCRKVAAGIAGGGDAGAARRGVAGMAGRGEAVRTVDEAEARNMLGTPPFVPLRVERALRPGMCTTLALTDRGAEIVLVEVQKAQGSGKLAVTGRAGDVLRETALLAFGFLRSSAEEFGLSAEQIGAWDYHVHFPGTGGPAEGASVGLPIFAAFLSVLRESTLPERTAVLGELTLTGRVLEARDVPEKLVAAKRAGIETVLVPDGNRKDVEPSRRSRLPEGVEVIYCRSAAEAALVLLPHPVGHCGSKP